MADITISEAKRAVDTLVSTLQQGEPGGAGGMDPSEIIKAGSLGHGTAVKGHYDLDLVIYSRSLDGQTIARENFDHWLNVVQTFLDRKFSPHQLSEKDRTSRSLQFKFDIDACNSLGVAVGGLSRHLTNKKIDVDLLVSPYWDINKPEEFYHFLQQIPQNKRSMFSVSASKWQVDFFSHQENQVKEFIKRAKVWRNSTWERLREGKPKSYLISCIVLRGYEIAIERVGRDANTKCIAIKTTEEVQAIVRNHQRVDIYWEKYYQRSQNLFPQLPPRIVDPANPANNLYYSGIAGPSNKKARDYGDGGGKWTNFSRYIDTLDLTRPIEDIY